VTVWELTHYPAPGRRRVFPTRGAALRALPQAPMSSQCELRRLAIPHDRRELCVFLNGLLAEGVTP